MIKKKVPKQAAEVFGDELADLSDSDDNEQNNESRGANVIYIHFKLKIKFNLTKSCK